MDGSQFDTKEESITYLESMEEFLPRCTYQIDPNDAVLLLRDPLLRASSSATNDSDRTLIEDCVKRLHECEKLVESTGISSSSSGRRLLKEEFAFVNKFVADCEAVLKTKFTDDRTWGSNVPEALVLKDMLGALPLANISGDEKFQVRGTNYLIDGTKVPAGPPLFFLRGLQVIEQPKGSAAAGHVAKQDWCGFPKTYDQYNEWLILNYMVPGTTHVNVVCLFSASREALEVINSIAHTPTQSHRKSVSRKHTHPLDSPQSTLASSKKTPAWANSLLRFYTGDNAYRNRTFKLFPRMVKASWAIQAAVGTKPALIGNKKLELKYYRGPGYLEVDIDLSSSTIATHILGMVRGVSKSMVVDLGVSLEGTTEDELPEAILGQARFDRVDLDSAVPLVRSAGTAANASSSGARSASSGSIFSFGWGGSSSTEVLQAVSASSVAVVEESVEVGALLSSDIFNETPAQKLRCALAAGVSASSRVISDISTVEK
eukprot:gene8182-9741_t